MQGTSESKLFETCAAEGRILLTLDRGFGEVLQFSERSGSVVILDLRSKPTLEVIEQRLASFLRFAASQPIEDAVCVIEASRVRVRQRPKD